MAIDLDTKAGEKKLRELADLAYRRELAAELAKLEARSLRAERRPVRRRRQSELLKRCYALPFPHSEKEIS
jgi:hypothetical protein